ncbi:MAG TPA: MFS transporter, partial [Candidatus Dormibacteraeota bacterium]
MSAPATVVNRRPEQRPAARAPVPTPVPSPAPAAAPASSRGWLLPLSVVVIGMFMAVLDTSIVNVAIPHIQNQFGGSNDDVQWVVTGYTLSMGVVVPVSGWLGDRFGLR